MAVRRRPDCRMESALVAEDWWAAGLSYGTHVEELASVEEEKEILIHLESEVGIAG